MSFIKVGSAFESPNGQERGPFESPQQGDKLIFFAWLSSNNEPVARVEDDRGLVSGTFQEVTEEEAKLLEKATQNRNTVQTKLDDIDDVLAQLEGKEGEGQGLPPLGTPAQSATPTPDKPQSPPPSKPAKTPKPAPAKKPSATSKKPTPAPARQSGGGNLPATTGTPTTAAREEPSVQNNEDGGDDPDAGDPGTLTTGETAGIVGVAVLLVSLGWSLLGKSAGRGVRYPTMKRGRARGRAVAKKRRA